MTHIAYRVNIQTLSHRPPADRFVDLAIIDLLCISRHFLSITHCQVKTAKMFRVRHLSKMDLLAEHCSPIQITHAALLSHISVIQYRLNRLCGTSICTSQAEPALFAALLCSPHVQKILRDKQGHAHSRKSTVLSGRHGLNELAGMSSFI